MGGISPGSFWDITAGFVWRIGQNHDKYQ